MRSSELIYNEEYAPDNKYIHQHLQPFPSIIILQQLKRIFRLRLNNCSDDNKNDDEDDRKIDQSKLQKSRYLIQYMK